MTLCIRCTILVGKCICEPLQLTKYFTNVCFACILEIINTIFYIGDSML